MGTMIAADETGPQVCARPTLPRWLHEGTDVPYASPALRSRHDSFDAPAGLTPSPPPSPSPSPNHLTNHRPLLPCAQIFYVDWTVSAWQATFLGWLGLHLCLWCARHRLRYDLEKPEALELAKRAIFAATHRDAYSGGTVRVYHIDKDGWKRISEDDSMDLYQVQGGGCGDAGSERTDRGERMVEGVRGVCRIAPAVVQSMCEITSDRRRLGALSRCPTFQLERLGPTRAPGAPRQGLEGGVRTYE